MNGLTTIAALPAAAGCKASLSAEKVRANAPVVTLADYFGAGHVVSISREFGWGAPLASDIEAAQHAAAYDEIRKRAERRARNA